MNTATNLVATFQTPSATVQVFVDPSSDFPFAVYDATNAGRTKRLDAFPEFEAAARFAANVAIAGTRQ